MLPWQHPPSLRQQLLQQATRHPGSVAWEGRATGSSRGDELSLGIFPHQGRRDSECAGSMPPNDRGCCSAACRSLRGSAHTSMHAPTLSLKKGCKALLELQRKTSQGGTDWLLEFLFIEIPTLCCHHSQVATYI